MSSFENRQILSKNLKRYLYRSGKDRKVVCEDLGVSYSTFSDWAAGRAYPRIDKIEMMADYFGISKSDLIEDKNMLNVPKKLSGAHIAFYEGTKDLTEEDLKALIPVIEALKNKK